MKRFLWLGMILGISVACLAFAVLNDTRIVLIGDSTVQSGQEDRPGAVLWGWGTVLKELYEKPGLEIDNQAVAGTSSRTFYRDRFPEVLASLETGDILMLQFGHNDVGSVTGDGKSSLKGIGTDTRTVTNPSGATEVVRTYGWYLAEMTRQAKAKGVRVIIVSPVPKNYWTDEFITRDVEEYALWAKQVAAAENADFLDLHNLVADFYDFQGKAIVDTYFPNDALHTSKEAATETANIVYEKLKELGIISESNTDENVWELLGSEDEISDVASAYGSVVGRKEGAVEVPYVVFTNATDGLVVKKKNASGQWEQVGGVLSTHKTVNTANGQNITQAYLWLSKTNVLYCSYVDGSAYNVDTNPGGGNRLNIRYYKESTNSWEPLADNAANLVLSNRGISPTGISQLRDNVNHAVAFDKNNVLYVVYGDEAASTSRKGMAHVKRFVNGAWELIGGGPIPHEGAPAYGAIGFSIAFDSKNRPFVSYAWTVNNPDNTGAIQVRYFDENQWKILGDVTSSGVGSSARFTQMGISQDRVFVYFSNSGASLRPTLVYSPIESPSWTSLQMNSTNNSVSEQVLVDAAGNMTIAQMGNYADIYVYYLTKNQIAAITPSAPLTVASFQTLGLPTSTSLDAGSRMSMSVSASGDPYIIYTKANSSGIVTPKVQRYLFPKIDFIPDTWEKIGSEFELTESASIYGSVTTRVEDGKVVPYASFTNADGLIVKRMVSAGVWEQVGDVLSAYNTVSGNNIAQARIWADKNNLLYVSYIDGNNSQRLAMKYYDQASDSWQPLGKDANNLYVSPVRAVYNTGVSQLRDNRNHTVIFDENNVPYVAYAHDSGTSSATGHPYVKRFVNGAWETVGGGAASATRSVSFSMAFDSNKDLYLSYLTLSASNSTAGGIEVLRYKDGAWSLFSTPVAGSARFPVMAISNDIMLFHYMNTGSSSRSFIVSGSVAGTPAWTSWQLNSNNTAVDENIVVDAVGNVAIAYIHNYLQTRVFYLPKEKVTLPLAASSFEQYHRADGDGLDGETGLGTSRLSIHLAQDGKIYAIYNKNNSAGVSTANVQRYHKVVDMTPPYVEEPEVDPDQEEVVTTARQVEALDRGLIAVRGGKDNVLVSWRLLGNEPMDLGFNVYRDGIKLNEVPITNSTNYRDLTAENGKYVVVPVTDDEEGESSYEAEVWTQGFLSLPLDMPPTGVSKDGTFYTHTANDLSVGDLDGDGEYEVIVKWEPTLSGDNGAGQRGKVYFDAYKLDGTKLWRIDMGINVRAGAHYTQFLVYDFDGDGKAEIAMRTSDGTVDGTGVVIGDPNADYRENSGFILTGPEYLTVFEGMTGKALASVDYVPARGRVSDWGDGYGNRVDRFVAVVAYLDGQRPSMVFGRGYYTRMVRAAWDWRDGKLTQRWVFDTNDRGNESYEHSGNHQMSVADVDNDGKDEIINGASIINDDGRKYSNTGRGHGDALHVSRMDPDRPNQMIWMPHESVSTYGDAAILLRDARDNESVVKVAASRDIGRAMAADIDPRYKGYEMWSAAGGLYNATGLQVATTHPSSMNFGIWWDGDLLRELLDGTNIYKWDYLTNTQKRAVDFSPHNVVSNNSTKSTPGLSADILGDWREEVIYRTADSKQLMIFSTAIPTDHKLYTLMHDTQYRVAIAWQNSGYNQPPHPSFYLGADMAPQEQPNVELVELEKRDQEITFPDMGESTYDQQQLIPQAMASSGLMVRYVSSNPAIVDVEGQRLKFVGVGTVNITAEQSGNVAWNPAEPVTKTLIVNKGVQTIEFGQLPVLTVGDKPYAAEAESDSGLPVTFRSENTVLASLVNNEILVHQEGRVGILAEQGGNELWLPAEPVRQELEILALPEMEVVKVVTPNGDGDNDVLIIRDIERYPENNVRIFNRQGQLLFHIDNYNNADRVFEGKDSSRKMLEDGTYFFKLEWVQDGKKMDQRGWFYIKK